MPIFDVHLVLYCKVRFFKNLDAGVELNCILRKLWLDSHVRHTPPFFLAPSIEGTQIFFIYCNREREREQGISM